MTSPDLRVVVVKPVSVALDGWVSYWLIESLLHRPARPAVLVNSFPRTCAPMVPTVPGVVIALVMVTVAAAAVLDMQPQIAPWAPTSVHSCDGSSSIHELP